MISGKSEPMRHLEELMREYHGLIITSDSILISLPLIGLSVLANVNWIPHENLAAIALLEVLSVVCFSGSLITTMTSIGNFLRGAAVVAALHSLETTTPEKEEEMARLGGSHRVELERTANKAAVEIPELQMFSPASMWLFVAGILFLVLSLCTLVLLFMV